MSKFEYFAVFESLLYGLAITHMLSTFGKMIIHRRSIQLYLPHLSIAIAGVFILSQRYFSGFIQEDSIYNMINSPWQFFFLLLFPLAVFYLIANQVSPRKVKDLNFKTFFWDNYKEVMVLFTLFASSMVYRNIFIDLHASGKNEFTFGSDYFLSFRFIAVTAPVILAVFWSLLALTLKKKTMVVAFTYFVLLYSIFLMSIN